MNPQFSRRFYLRFSAGIILLLAPHLAWSRVDGRVYEGSPKTFSIHSSQTLEHLLASNTSYILKRELWDLTCKLKPGDAGADNNCMLIRTIINPCGIQYGQGASITSTRHETSRGTFKLTRVDLVKGEVEFQLADLGGDGVYGMNSLSGSFRFKVDKENLINFTAISANGKYQGCTDDYDDVRLLPPEKDYSLNVPVQFRAGPRQ